MEDEIMESVSAKLGHLKLGDWTYPELKFARDTFERQMFVLQENGKQQLAEKFQAMADALGVPMPMVLQILSNKRPRGRPRLKQKEEVEKG